MCRPMPAKMRALEGTGAGTVDWAQLGLPGADDCERRAFCELAVRGARSGAHPAHMGLWKLANRYTDNQTRLENGPESC